MTEKELQAAVIELAQTFGWKVAHFRPAMNARGDWRTPVAADGKGFPDLVMVSSTTVAFVELKSKKGRLSTEQKEWLEALLALCELVHQGRDFDEIGPRTSDGQHSNRLVRSGVRWGGHGFS